MVGFLGPNGAGKTTTMRMLTGFLPPTDGSARICGHDIFEEPLAARRAIGYLPETPPLYPEMTVSSYVDYVARIKDVPRRERRAKVERALERCGLADVSRRVIGTLSKGFRQRVGLAQAIVHEPPVLILDEPTIGLDPIQIGEIRQLIADARGRRRRRAAHGDPLHAHPARGRGDLPPRGDDQRGPQDDRRTARRAHAAAAAASRSCSRASPRRRAAAEEAAVKHVPTVAWRELRSLFVSPVAYGVLSLFAVLAGLFFIARRRRVQHLRAPAPAVPGASTSSQKINLSDHLVAQFYDSMGVVLLFLVPGITMGLFAAEKTNGTQELLLTSPLTIWDVVLGKFAAGAGFIAILVAMVAAFPGLLFVYGDPEVGKTVVGPARPAADRLDLRRDRRVRVVGHAQPGGELPDRVRAAARACCCCPRSPELGVLGGASGLGDALTLDRRPASTSSRC